MKPKRHTIKPRGILSAQEVKDISRLWTRALQAPSPERMELYAYMVEQKMPAMIRDLELMKDLAPGKKEGI